MNQINFRSNYILLLGDTHSLQVTLHIVQRRPNIENTDIVFLGDGGLGFYGDETDTVYLKRISDEAGKRNIQFYQIRGNHDNPAVWKKGYGFNNLQLVQDYTVGVFPNGRRALLVGGGVSVDRYYRKDGLDYWTDEGTPYVKQTEQFDYLFAHDAPDYFNHSTESLKYSPYKQLLIDDPPLFVDALKQRNIMDQIVDDIKPKYLYSGHFHNTLKEQKNGMNYQALDIEEIVEFYA